MSELLSRAIDAKLDAASIVALIGYSEREVDANSQADFDAAMVEFQAEVPPIGKSRTVDTGKYKYSYAELDSIVKVVRPLLAKHGLYVTFDDRTESASVVCRCIVRHKNGGERASEFTAPIDEAAKMNDTQKVGSAQTYAHRYAYIAALGLTIAGDDDDAQGAGGKAAPPVTPEQAAELSALVQATATELPKLLDWLKAPSLEEVKAADFARAKKLLESRKAKA